uniref:TRF2/HOY1 PH-like domain-containing protein n=1 Tax=Chenopodium quinoa TaxID=63459 RepID=A0A803MS19_CHEQI
MVHRIMDSVEVFSSPEKSCRKKVKVKAEFEDSAENSHGFFSKRPKFDPLNKKKNGGIMEYNPLEEPSRLGLKLKKSPSFLDLIHMKLSQEKSAFLAKTLARKEKGASSAADNKLKASNFPATLLKIGSWEYKSRYEGDLVAKCYFAKHKLVWEVLDGGLKNKIEIQWSDIMAIKANYPDNEPGTLDVVLSRQPLFFREINPQPRKHTLWQATTDFTTGQASLHRNPAHGFELKTEGTFSYSGIRDGVSVSGLSSSDIENKNYIGSPTQNSHKNSQLVPDMLVMEGDISSKYNDADRLKLLNQIKLPGLHPSMSVGDLVNHIGDCISEQMRSDNPSLSINEPQKWEILDEITQYLLNDSQTLTNSDEKRIMSKVNSLCCLLQMDDAGVHNAHISLDNVLDLAVGNTQAAKQLCENQTAKTVLAEGSKTGLGNAFQQGTSSSRKDSVAEQLCENRTAKTVLAAGSETGLGNDFQQGPSMSRKDSVGELLLHLPRIASLPQFLFPEDSGIQGR